MNAYQNFVIIKTNRLFNDKATFKGVGGRDLVLDPSFDPQQHICTEGEVVSVPLHLSKRPLSQEHRGIPPYTGTPFIYKYLADIEPDVMVGDKLNFHFNVIYAGQYSLNLVKSEGVHPDRVWYYKVSYDQIISATREGKIIPIGSFILADPDFESWDDILRPTYTNLKDEQGNFIPKPKEQWIQVKVAPEYKFLTAYVKHIGKALKSEVIDLAEGQKIWYRRNADWMNKINGKDYFAIRHYHIIGKEMEGKFVPINGYMLITPEEEPIQTETGIFIKKKLTKRGVVVHGGDSHYKNGLTIMFGEAGRQEIVLDKQKYLLIKKGDVMATLERNVKP